MSSIPQLPSTPFTFPPSANYNHLDNSTPHPPTSQHQQQQAEYDAQQAQLQAAQAAEFEAHQRAHFQAQAEREALYRAVAALGNYNQDRARESQAQREVLQQLVARLTAPFTFPPSSTSTGSGVPKHREPRMFNGKADQVDSFLREIDHALYLQRHSIVSDREKSLYFGFYLSDGSPSAWYSTIEKTNNSLFDNYAELINRFKDHFDKSDRYAAAQRKLRNLEQTGAASSYSSRFDELATELDMTDQTKIQQYYDGLKESVKTTLSNRKGRYFTAKFEDFKKECISIDNELYQLQLDAESSSSSIPSSTSSLILTPSPSSYSNDDVVPMEIDAIRRGPLSNEEKERRWKLNLCLYCGQGQHFASDCPNKSTSAKKRDSSHASTAASGKA